MKTLKFNRTECGVDFLLNVLACNEVRNSYFSSEYSATDFFEVFFFKKGNGYLYLNHQKNEIVDNSIVFISPFQKRKWDLDTNKLEFRLLVFQEDFLNDFFSDKVFTYRLLYFYQLEWPLIMKVTSEMLERYLLILFEIKAELKTTQKDSVHIIRSLIYYLLQKLNREYAEINRLPLDKTDIKHAYQFKKLIEEHIGKKQRVNDYLPLLKVSRISLNKAVKEQFNTTAADLLKQRLLIEIKNYLIHSELTVFEIAHKLNFSEPSHLMRFFKKQTGLTTSQFLDTYQNGTI